MDRRDVRLYGFIAAVVFLLAGLTRAEFNLERPGAYYWGDSGAESVADGMIGPDDLLAAENLLLGLPGSYEGVRPPDARVQDLDGDFLAGPNDLSALNNWLLGVWTDGDTGRPAEVRVITPAPEVLVGESVPLTAEVYDTGGMPDSVKSPRLGFGVVFEITGGCATDVFLYGRDVTPTVGNGRDQFTAETGLGARVFEYSDVAGSASVKIGAVSGTFCGGEQVEISAYVPSDAEAGISPGRLSARVTASTLIVGNIESSDPDTSMTCTVTDINEGQTLPYTCMGNMGTDLTAMTSITGDCTGGAGTITGNQVLCGVEPAGACQITCPDIPDWSVTLNNNDTVVSTLISCPSSVWEGDSLGCTTTKTWSDTCAEDLSAGNSCTGYCASDCSVAGEVTDCQSYGECWVHNTAASNSPLFIKVENDEYAFVEIDPPGPVYTYPGAFITFEGYEGCPEGGWGYIMGPIIGYPSCLDCSISLCTGGIYVDCPIGTIGQVCAEGYYGSACAEVIVGDEGLHVTSQPGSLTVDPSVQLLAGHSVQMELVSCSGNDTAKSCTVRLINKDSDEYMVNAMIETWCNDCFGNEMFENADCTGSPCVRSCGVDSTGDYGCGTSSPINNPNGFCLAEDGDFSSGSPYTVKGCRYNEVPGGVRKPVQTVSPAGGYQDVVWHFWTPSGNTFNFYAILTATWIPLNPHSDSRLIANDWMNRTTLQVSIVDLDDKGADVRGHFNIGSYQHSTVLAGYGAPGNSSHVNLDQGQYFALNLAIEMPDRVENQKHGFYAGFQDYEYYTLMSSIIRFNPQVVRPVMVAGAINTNNMTFVLSGGQPTCNAADNFCAHEGTAGLQRRMYDSVTGFANLTTSNSQIAFADKGYIYQFPLINAVAFSWNLAAPTINPYRYYTMGGSFLCTRTANILPRHAGHYGLTHMDIASLPCTGSTPLRTSETTVLVDEPPDPEPDLPVGLYYFKVEPVGGGVSPLGKGTMFFPDAHQSYYGYKLGYTAGTPAGGRASGSDDWQSFCYPLDPLYLDPTNQGCPPSPWEPTPDVDFIYKSTEIANRRITQTGQAVPGATFTAGSYISWPVSMTVQ